ncbi:DUF4365 domain-containing protein [Enterococcus casseliflavus]|uniref:DUF4365 domain-containing protein n=1 Tax=Enterococcus casseliflavus TaxID=37734 RepID=A0A415EPZ4_ENTCA|nr:DUF4365 domain-containing protein [Enterococcus casseliflavus]
MANSTERIGVHSCGIIAERNNWLFREQPVNDVGIDAHMELIESSGKPKQLLALQIKSGSSWFKEKKDGCVIFRDINERQYNYWSTNSLPCIVVLYNTEDDMCIWQKLTTETIERTSDGKGKGFFVKVPLTQVFLNDSSKETLLSFTNLPEHITNYNFLLSQKQFMKIIQDGGEVKLHSTEWVNKSSGRGDMEVIVNDGESIRKYSFPYWFPFTPYDRVFPRLFPWAEFSADEVFFMEDDENNWREYHCYYDKEDDEWLIVGDSFEEYRKNLDPMRSINHSGEVAEYMMVLSLNELGRSFLNIDKFVSQNRPYASARPKV